MHEPKKDYAVKQSIKPLPGLKSLNFLLLVIFSILKTDAQSLYFDYLGKNTLNEDMVSSFMGNINLNLDGGHTIIASTSSGSEGLYVVRLDKDGKKLWSKSIGSSAYDYGSGIAQTADSGFLITGSYNLNLSLGQILLTKLDKNGAHQWSRVMGDGSKSCNGWDVIVEPGTGNIYVLGTTYNESAAYWNYDATLTKLNSNGNMIWSKFYGTSGYELVYAMTFLKSGNIAVTGEGVLFVVDTAGNLFWSRTPSQNESWDIQPTADSGMIVSGRFTWSFIDEDFVLEKIDKNGNLVWYKRMGDASNSSTHQQGVSCYVNPEGEIYVIGWGWSSPDGPDDTYGILVKLTSSGNIIWSKSIDPDSTTTVACKVAASGYNDGINIAGYTLAPNPSYWNIFDANLDSSGYLPCLISSFQMATRSTTSSVFNASLTSKTGYTSSATTPTITNVSNDTSTVCSEPIILPIELVSFNGEVMNDGNYLYWETASELNNNYFTLERSPDGRSFTEVTQVMGAGTTDVPHSYDGWDYYPSSGWNYYRLKQTDYDGKFCYSPVIVLDNFSSQISSVIVSPNPTPGKLQVEINSQSDASVRIEITDLSGKLLSLWNEELRTGSNVCSSSLDNLPSGIYVMKIFSDENAMLFAEKIEKY